MNFFRQLFQLILSPGHGWVDIEAADTPVAELSRTGFYPLTALTALSVFAGALWHPATSSLQSLLTGAMITFAMFFAGYFAGVLSLTATLDKYVYAPSGQGSFNQWKCHTFSIYVMAMLELITIISNCVPITLAITMFLPLLIPIVMWKGRAFMNVSPEATPRFIIVAVTGVLIPPYIVKWLLTALLPGA